MEGRLENELNIQNKINAKLSTMPEYVTEWYHNLAGSNKTASTCFEYICKVHKFLEYIDSNIKDVSTDMFTPIIFDSYFQSIKTVKEGKKVKETSISLRQTTWTVLNSFCKFLYKRGYISENYIEENISRPTGSDLARINDERILLTEDDFKKVLNCAKRETYYRNDREGLELRDYAILAMFMSTGIRKTALSSINIEDIDFENNCFKVIDKGNTYRKCVLSELLKDAITEWLEVRNYFIDDNNPTDALFITSNGTRLSGTSMDWIVDKYCQKALHKHISPHKLRSGFITIMVNQTGNIALASKMVGHKNISTTNRYYATGGKESEIAASIIDNIL